MNHIKIDDNVKKKLGEKATCDNCGSKDGKVCLDPFMYDIHNKAVVANLCDRCYNNIAGDI